MQSGIANAARKLVQTPLTLSFIAIFNERTVSSYSGKSVGPRGVAAAEVTLAVVSNTTIYILDEYRRRIAHSFRCAPALPRESGVVARWSEIYK